METVESIPNISVKMFDLKKNALAVVNPINLIDRIFLWEFVQMEQAATIEEMANAKEGQIFTCEHLSFEQNGDDRIYHTYIEGDRVSITINQLFLKIETTNGESNYEKEIPIKQLLETEYDGDMFFGLLELVGINLR